MSATNEFTVFVGPIHNGPSIAASIQAAVNEGGQLNLTNPASSTDIPQLDFSYQLVGAPQGAAVDGSGVIVWVPTEAQGPSTNLFEMVVTDSGTPPLSATSMVQIVVAEVNTAPMLGVVADRTIEELATLVVPNAATDSDLPANGLSYHLEGAPAGATIDAQGVITWTPTEAQGPSTNLITVVVTDDGSPVLSATNTFTVIVSEVNTAPVLASITDQTVAELATLTVATVATDNDQPANALSYRLEGAPAGATIDAEGVITWTPTEAEGPSTNLITVVATDDGSPALSATNTFTVIVSEVNTAPALASVPTRPWRNWPP